MEQVKVIRQLIGNGIKSGIRLCLRQWRETYCVVQFIGPLPLGVLGRRFWVALFLSFCFWRMTISPMWSEQNRFFFHWQPSDALAIGGLLLGVATLFLAFYELLAHLGMLGRVGRDLSFMLIGGFWLKVAVLESIFADGNIPLVWSFVGEIVYLLLLFLYVSIPALALRTLKNVCLILSPVVVIFAAAIFVADRIDSTVSSNHQHVLSTESPEVRKVVFIVFDGNSYDRMFDKGMVLPDYPNMRRLASESLVFNNASSPAAATLQSVTQILCGMKGKVIVDGKQLFILSQNGRVATKDTKHIFSEFARLGYRTTWHGMYLPCGQLFPSGLDEGITKCYYKPIGYSPWDVATSLLSLHAGKRLSGPVPFFRKMWAWVEVSGKAEYDEWIHAQALAQIRDPRSGFAFLHYRIPHEPFIHDDDGYVTDMSRLREPSLQAYVGATRSVDRKLGELLDELDQQPWCDQTLLIVTADHGFRNDPQSKERKTDVHHVPLLVRWPGLTARADFDNYVDLVNLKDVLVGVVERNESAGLFAEILIERSK